MSKSVTDLLSGMDHDQSPLYISLYTFRESFKRHLRMASFSMVQTDDSKRTLRTNKDVDYPYGYFSVQDLAIQRDLQVIKTIQRVGYASQDPDIDSASLLKGYLFPAKCTIECHYFAKDIIQAFSFAERLGLMLAGGIFNSSVTLDGHEWMVTIDDQQSPISIPTSVLEDESNPALHEITTNVEVSFRVGIIKEVPKVNNRGKVSQSVRIKDE
jgi:hypothetical protein